MENRKTDQLAFARLKNCMRRAEKGGTMTIGFFGGSITQGCSATKHENSYSFRVFKWWEKEFPRTEFSYVNGGIGGTSSHFGAARIWQDLLMYQPDMVVVDFSVNDIGDDEAFFQETYEGVIRRILTCFWEPAVLILNNVYYDSGFTVQESHNEIGAWYHIPHVSMKDTLYRKVEKGIYRRDEITQDGLHPNDRGHELVASEIIALLGRIKAYMWEEEEMPPVPDAMTANAYEHARRLTIREAVPELAGFRIDTEEKTGHLDVFKNGWIGGGAGERILFEEEASCIAVQYRKSIARPALCAKLVLDGDHEHPWVLDGNFREDWGDSAQILPILHHGQQKMHRIEIEIPGGQPEGATPFYLLSLILA